MRTSLLAELTRVSVITYSSFATPVASLRFLTGRAVIADQLQQLLVVYSRLKALRLLLGDIAQPVFRLYGRRYAAPLGHVCVTAALAGAHGGAVDRLLEAVTELHFLARAPALHDDLRRNIPPVNYDLFNHETPPLPLQPGWSRVARNRSGHVRTRAPGAAPPPARPRADCRPASATGTRAGGNCRNRNPAIPGAHRA